MSRNDGTLKVCFWTELDNFLFVLVPAGDTTCILDQYIEYTLWLSEFSISAREVEVNNITDWQQFLQSTPVSPVISIPVLLPDPSPPLLSPGVDLKPAKRPAMNPVVCHLSGFTRVPSHYGLLGLQLHLNIWFLLLHRVPPSLWLCHHPCSHWLCLIILSPQLHLGSFCSALAFWSSDLISDLPDFTWLSFLSPWLCPGLHHLMLYHGALSGNPTPPLCCGLPCWHLCGLFLCLCLHGLFLLGVQALLPTPDSQKCWWCFLKWVQFEHRWLSNIFLWRSRISLTLFFVFFK